MARRKSNEASLFKTIRKPTAPPSKKVGDDKPEEKIHPALRKTKHKKKHESDGDL